MRLNRTLVLQREGSGGTLLRALVQAGPGEGLALHGGVEQEPVERRGLGADLVVGGLDGVGRCLGVYSLAASRPRGGWSPRRAESALRDSARPRRPRTRSDRGRRPVGCLGQVPAYAARCSPVRVERAATTSAGVPSKTIRPPSWPAPGPRSMIQSARAMTAWCCA